MKLLLFEWLTGGGLWVDCICPGEAQPMLKQGRRMLSALVADGLAADFEVCVLLDCRFESPAPTGLETASIHGPEQLANTLKQMAAIADAILFVAPETNGCLLQVCKWLQPWADKWLCPDIEFVRLASDKTRTCNFLSHQGVPTPSGGLMERRTEWSRLSSLKPPLVIKPNDGAGSESIRIIDDLTDLDLDPTCGDWRVEELVSGEAVSVSVVHAADQTRFFQPMGQVFDRQPIGSYVGSRFPLLPEIENRALRLARQTVLALPRTRGFIGIDMVIGDIESLDTVIEINPRITMSYCEIADEPGPASFIFGTDFSRARFASGRCI